MECKCVEGIEVKEGKSQISELLDTQEQLKNEPKEMSLLMAKKDTEIAHLKSELAKTAQGVLGLEKISTLRAQNAELTTKIRRA